MNQFAHGLLTMASIVAAFFFARYWKMSGDRLFVFFALAFAALAANWSVLSLLNPAVETQHYVYLIRLVAFVLIIAGIVDKNRRERRF